MAKIRWDKNKFLPRDDCEECEPDDRRGIACDATRYDCNGYRVVCYYRCGNGHTWRTRFSGNYRGRYPYPHLTEPEQPKVLVDMRRMSVPGVRRAGRTVAQQFPPRHDPNGTTWYKPENGDGWTSLLSQAHSSYRTTKRPPLPRRKANR